MILLHTQLIAQNLPIDDDYLFNQNTSIYYKLFYFNDEDKDN